MAQKIAGSAKAARRRLRKRASAIETRKKKEFTYRGYTLDEMRAMTFQEVLGLLPSRARRAYVRGLDREQAIFVEHLKAARDGGAVRTHCRDVPVLPEFVGRKVAVHNGKAYVEFDIKPEMIGHYLGEFAMTRKEVTHSGPGVGATRSSKFMPLK